MCLCGFKKEQEKICYRLIKEHQLDVTVPPFDTQIVRTSLKLDSDFGWKIFNRCKILLVEYFIRVKVLPVGCHDSITNYIALKVGTIHNKVKINIFD